MCRPVHLCAREMGFTKKIYRLFETGALAIAAISSVIFMLVASGWELHLDLSYLWAILPYVTFFLISSIVHARQLSPILPLATCITSILILSFTLVVYIDGMFIHTSSTSALLFLFVPFYLLVGGPLTLGLILGIYRLRRYFRS